MYFGMVFTLTGRNLGYGPYCSLIALLLPPWRENYGQKGGFSIRNPPQKKIDCKEILFSFFTGGFFRFDLLFLEERGSFYIYNGSHLRRTDICRTFSGIRSPLMGNTLKNGGIVRISRLQSLIKNIWKIQSEIYLTN